MAFKAGEGVVELTAASTIEKTFASVRKSAARLQKTLQGVGRVARNMLLIGGAALGGFVMAAAKTEEAMNKFHATFRENSDDVEAWAKTLASAVNRSSIEIMGALSTYQSFFVGLGFGGDRATELSKKMESLALDFASFHDLTDEDALQRFVSAMSGSGEVLQRYGIDLKESSIQQEILTLGLTDGTRAATQQEKAIARLSLISKAMGAQGAIGDAAKTMGTFTNVLKGLKGAVFDTSSAIGMAFIPAMTKMASALRDTLPAIIEFVKNNGEAIVKTAKWTATILAALIVLPKLAKAIDLVSKAMLFLLANPIVALIVGIATIVAWIVIANTKGDSFGEKMENIAKSIMAAWTKLGDFFQTVVFSFQHIGDLIKLAFLNIALGVVVFVNSIKHWFTKVLPAHLTWFGENFVNIFVTIGRAFKTFSTNLGTNIGALWNAMLGFLRGEGFNFEWTGLLDGFESALTKLPDIAARHESDIEASLRGARDAAGTALEKEFAASVAARHPAADGAAKDEAAKADPEEVAKDVATTIGEALTATAPAAITQGMNMAAGQREKPRTEVVSLTEAFSKAREKSLNPEEKKQTTLMTDQLNKQGEISKGIGELVRSTDHQTAVVGTLLSGNNGGVAGGVAIV